MSGTMKAYRGMGMEGSIAHWYDRTTRRDMPDLKMLANRIAKIVRPGGEVFEVAPGPGFLSIELAKRGFQVSAIDISKTFVEIAQHNSAAEGVAVRFGLGNASALPVARCKRRLRSVPGCFQELHRAGESDGRDVPRPSPRRHCPADRHAPRCIANEIKRYVNSLGVSLLEPVVHDGVFRGMLIRRAYPLEEIRRMALEAGWTEPRIETSPLGFEAWLTRT